MAKKQTKSVSYSVSITNDRTIELKNDVHSWVMIMEDGFETIEKCVSRCLESSYLLRMYKSFELTENDSVVTFYK